MIFGCIADFITWCLCKFVGTWCGYLFIFSLCIFDNMSLSCVHSVQVQNTNDLQDTKFLYKTKPSLTEKRNSFKTKKTQTLTQHPVIVSMFVSNVLFFTLHRFQLPEYVLDFVFVIPSKVISQTAKITSEGSISVSFHVICKHLDTGNTISCPVTFSVLCLSLCVF